MNELNDLRTRGVETWVQTQKVLEKEMSDEEARHKKEAEKANRGVETWSQTQKVDERGMSDEEARRKEETEKAKEDRKEGRKENLEKLRKKLVRAQKAQIAQHLHAREIVRKVHIRADTCIRIKRALRVKTKNVGLTLVQFQCKDGATNLPQGLDKKLLKIDFVRCIEPNGKFTAIKHQEVVFNEEVEVKEVEQITFPAQETIEKEDEERLKEKEIEKVKKEIEKKKVRKANHSESSDEECKKFASQARPKVPMADKGMTYARYEIKHKTVKHQEEWRVDKYIAEAQQIADTGYSVPAPMKCGMVIRGLNSAETQVHLIGSRLSIRAVDLEEQTMEVIKAFTDTNRVLPKAYKHWNEDDAAEFLALAKENHGEEISDETLVTQPEKLSEGKLSHIGATMGGFVAQEIMKVCSGKLMPIFQRLCFSALECLLKDYSALAASKISQKLFLAEAVEKGWKVCSLDVSAAFLQGDRIQLYNDTYGEINVPEAVRRLWGDVCFKSKTRKFAKKSPHGTAKRSFVDFILKPLYKLFAQVMGVVDTALPMLCEQVGTRLAKDEMKLNIRSLLGTVCSKFLEDFNGVTSMCKEHIQIPSPVENAKQKVGGTSETVRYEVMVRYDQDKKLMMGTTKQHPTEDNTYFHVMGRVMSGTLQEGQEVRLLGENQAVFDEEDNKNMRVGKLWIYQARYKEEVNRVPTGRWVRIEGINQTLVETPTITDMQGEEGLYIFRPLLYGESELLYRKVMGSFMNLFTVGNKEDTDFVCVGWNMKQSRHSITVSQDNHIKKVVFKNQCEPYVEVTCYMQNKESCVRKPLNICTEIIKNAGAGIVKTSPADNAEKNPADGVVVFIDAAEGTMLNTERVIKQAGCLASSQHGACSTPKLFAQLYSNTYEEINVPEFVRRLWEDTCLDPKTRKLTKRPPHGLVQRGLMEYILEPRYKLLAQVMGNVDKPLPMLCEQLGIRMKKDEMKLNIRLLLGTVCSRFLEDLKGFTSMCEEHIQIPSPVENAKQKVGGTSETERYEDMVGCDQDGRLVMHTTKQYPTEDKTWFHMLGRVMSGMLYEGQEMRLLGKNYTVCDEENSRKMRVGRPWVDEARYKVEKNGELRKSEPKLKKICEFEMKTHPKKAKKHSHSKDCKEQPRETCLYERVEIGNNVTALRKLVGMRIYSITWGPGRSQVADPFTKQEACREEGKTDVQRYCKKFSNIIPFSVKKQNYHFEPKKTWELEMKTHPKKAKKYSYHIVFEEENSRNMRVGKMAMYEARYKVEGNRMQTGNGAITEGTDRPIVKTSTIADIQGEEESGEQVILGTRELYSDYVTHDLRKPHSETEVRVVDSVVSFSETIMGTPSLKCFAETPNEKNKMTMVAEPMEKGPEEDVKNEEEAINWNKKRPGEFLRTKYDWELRAARSTWVFDLNLTSPNTPVNDVSLSEVDKSCYNITRQTKVEACKVDVHRSGEKFYSIFTFPVKKQNYKFEPKKIYELEMKTRPMETKRDSYIKDCKEQPREIHDQCEKKNIQPLCDTQERMIHTYEPTENEGSTDRGQNSGSWNQCWTLRPNECDWEKFSNSFPLLAKEQIYRFEMKKTYKLEMKVCPKETNKDRYIKDCKEQPRKICERSHERDYEKFSNSFSFLAKEQIHRFEPKKTYELEMKTCPKETKTDRYIKDCKEQPREIRDQSDIQPLCDTLERMVRLCKVNRKRGNNRSGTGLRKLEPMLDFATK